MCPSLPSVQERPVVVAVTEVLSGCRHSALAVCPQDVWDVCWASRAMNYLNFVWLGELLGEWPQLKGTQTRKWNWGSACSCTRNPELCFICLLETGYHAAEVGLELTMQQRWLRDDLIFLPLPSECPDYRHVHNPWFVLAPQTEPRVSCVHTEHSTLPHLSSAVLREGQQPRVEGQALSGCLRPRLWH